VKKHSDQRRRSWGYAGAAVIDAQTQQTVLLRHAQRYAAAGRAVLDGIADQVLDQGLEAARFRA